MVITYLGGQCLKITQGDLTIAVNPPGKGSALKGVKFGSDIVISTLNHDDFNGIENASYGERAPFVVDGPGEYEVKGVTVQGFGGPTSYGKKPGLNTVYLMNLEGMNLCFLGALEGELPAAANEALDEIDILFTPVGGAGTLDYSGAAKLAVKLEPKAIVPLQYDAASLKSFLKEAGGEGAAPQEKLTIKRKDLEGKEGEVIVLQS
jgi:L-ascorbate metabolism protein UlaG (beta-lactamase superfamily)